MNILCIRAIESNGADYVQAFEIPLNVEPHWAVKMIKKALPNVRNAACYTSPTLEEARKKFIMEVVL